MRATTRVVVIVVGMLLLSLTAYARFAPLDAPETRGAVPGTVVLDAHGNVLERDASAGLRIPTTLDRVALPAALRCRPDRDRSRARQFDGAIGRVDDHAAAGAASLPRGRLIAARRAESA